jgi:hypothetical protein
MKTRILIAYLLFSFFCFNDAYAVSNKVLVIPFVSELQGMEEVAVGMTEAAVAQVKASSGNTYVTQPQFLENWFGKELKILGTDMKEEFKDLRKLLPMLDPESVGTISEYKQRWNVDFIIFGVIKKQSEAGQIYTQIVSMDTGRFFYAINEFHLKQAENTVRKQISSLLSKEELIRKTEADVVINPVMSTVRYDIRSLKGEDIYIKADYTSKRPDPPLQSVEIVSNAGPTEKEKVLIVRSRENKNIEMSFFYKNSRLESLQLYTTPPQGAQGEGFREALSVLSKDNHVITFIFEWSKGKLQEVRVEPLINPYYEVR